MRVCVVSDVARLEVLAFRHDTRGCCTTYKGYAVRYESSGNWCTECGEGDIEGDELVRVAMLVRDFKARVDGVDASG